MTSKSQPKKIEVFRPGTFKPMIGDPVTFSEGDLKSIAEVYDVTAPTPAVIGHPKTDAPAYGWAKSFAFDEASQRLVAELDEIEPAFAESVAAGRYKKISLELFSPAAPNNPKPGTWYPKHIGFLGAAAPAVTGLKPVSFAEGGEGVLTFCLGGDDDGGIPALRDVAGLFRALRDFMIDKFGLEAADKALPAWSINWINDQADADRGAIPFSEPTPETEDMTTKTADAAALEQRAQEIEARERAVIEREQKAARTENLSFAEALVSEGKLLPALKDKAVALLDAVADKASSVTVSFAEGDEVIEFGLAQAVKDILSAAPKVVSFGELVPPEGDPVGAVSFSAPPGVEVDRHSLDLHARAVEHQKKHPGMSIIEAAQAVQS